MLAGGISANRFVQPGLILPKFPSLSTGSIVEIVEVWNNKFFNQILFL